MGRQDREKGSVWEKGGGERAERSVNARHRRRVAVVFKTSSAYLLLLGAVDRRLVLINGGLFSPKFCILKQ